MKNVLSWNGIDNCSCFYGMMILLLMCFSSVWAGVEKSEYTFGVVPQFDSKRIQEIWQPILDKLQAQTGIKLSLRGSTNIPQFEEEFSRGEFDFVYMNPYHILMANQRQGYIPLVRDVGRSLHGIVVVRKDSPIHKAKQLSGQTIAFPAPNALAAALMPRAILVKSNINFTPKYVNTHTSVYLNVALGLVDAGGGVQKTLAQQKPEIREALRVLFKTQSVAPHPICAHPKVASKIRDRIRDAFLALGVSDSGKKLLAHIPIQQVGKATLSDYLPIQKLGLEKLFQRNTP